MTTLTAVSGDSMLPHLHTGDLVVASKAKHVRQGDVVVFQPPGIKQTVIHRVISGGPRDGYRTQGDNNTTADPWVVKSDRLRGAELFRIPRLGLLIHNPLFLASLLLLILAGALYTPRERPATPER